MNERITIYKQFAFEASHVLPKHPSKCSRLHGHSWKLTVGVSGPVDRESGFVVDFGSLSKLVDTHVIHVVDHHHLGQGTATFGTEPSQWHRPALGEDFYPSSENLVLAFARILGPLIQELGPPERVEELPLDHEVKITPPTIRLEEVSLEETCTCKATWRPTSGRT